MRVLAKISSKESTAVDAKGRHLSPDAFIWRSTGELGVDLVEELTDVEEELEGEIVIEGVLVVVGLGL